MRYEKSKFRKEYRRLHSKKNYLKLTGTSGTDYYLVKIIGRGTFGVVYEAYGNKPGQTNFNTFLGK